jgi:DNA-binding beta-propeller fold protein YncE
VIRISGKALGFVVLSALLCGCEASQLQNGATGLVTQRGFTGHRAGGAGSWMSPKAGKTELLYVSSVLTGDVYVYSYSNQQLMGTLTGFEQPYGLCADKAGNVWIVNDGASEIVEYAHGGTSPIATLSDPGEYPEGCSVDPVTGNLAVTNFYSTSGAGSVSIYAGAQGAPHLYADSAMANYRFCGYDAQRNLFVDGVTGSSAFAFAELPKGSSTFTNIALNQKIEWPGGVQWDGKYVAVGDTDAAAIYQTNGAKGQVKGTTQLDGANYVNQFWIDTTGKKKRQHESVVAPSQDGGVAGLYNYPAGGSPKATITVSEPFGATVSK